MGRCVLWLAAILLMVASAVNAQTVNFAGMNSVAAWVYGTYFSEPSGWTLVPYQGKVYFSVYNDGTSEPGKVYCYNPTTSWLSTIAQRTTGQFTTMTQMGGLLYIADSLGDVSTYNGSSLGSLTLSAWQFNSNSYVQAIAQFNGQMFLGTTSGNVYQYGQQNPVYSTATPITDICLEWKPLCLQPGRRGNSNGVAKSNGINVSFWTTTISGVYDGSEGFCRPQTTFIPQRQTT